MKKESILKPQHKLAPLCLSSSCCRMSLILFWRMSRSHRQQHTSRSGARTLQRGGLRALVKARKHTVKFPSVKRIYTEIIYKMQSK